MAHVKLPRTYAVPNAFVLGTASRVRRAHAFAVAGLGANTVVLDSRVEAALHRLAIDLGNACTEAWKAVEQGPASRLWQSIIGAESTAAAGRAYASAQCSLAKAVKARVDSIIAAGDINKATALLNEAAAGRWTDLTLLRETMNFISITGGVRTVAVESAKDAAAVAQKSGERWLFVVKYLPYIAVGVLGLAAISFGRRAANMLPLPATQALPAAQVAGYGRRWRRRRRRA